MEELWTIFLRMGVSYNVTFQLSQVLIPVFPSLSFRNHPPRLFGAWVEAQCLAVAVGRRFHVPMVFPLYFECFPTSTPTSLQNRGYRKSLLPF